MPIEYSVHFQKGTVVGTRRSRIVTVMASNPAQAAKLAKKQGVEPGFRIVRIDHFESEDSMRLIIDY